MNPAALLAAGEGNGYRHHINAASGTRVGSHDIVVVEST